MQEQVETGDFVALPLQRTKDQWSTKVNKNKLGIYERAEKSDGVTYHPEHP
jgi:hypothetical protein